MERCDGEWSLWIGEDAGGTKDDEGIEDAEGIEDSEEVLRIKLIVLTKPCVMSWQG